MDPTKVLLYPLSTEKSIRMMEAENKLIFVVAFKATKTDVKTAFEKEFKVKVIKVNTYVDKTGKKRALIKLSDETQAIDVASRLGLM